MKLRGYQDQVIVDLDTAWQTPSVRNIVPLLPTGGGKTVIMAKIAKRHVDAGGFGIAMAHRSVLIGQLSNALAAAGVMHDIIAQKEVVKTIVGEHMEDFGRSFYVPGAPFKVASVDTMPGRAAVLASWIARCTLGFTDEGHHVLSENKWGRECNRFTNPEMRWLFPTAESERADGKGLGRHAHGLADAIVKGPPPAQLIAQGYLTNFIIRGPQVSDLNLDGVEVGANGDYNLKQLRAAVHGSRKIIGNIVDTYKDLTMGMLAIVFAVDVEHARAITKEFNDKGVAAELITGNEDDETSRRNKLRRYRNRETLVLVNVDLFGEGFDLPAIEVVIMARPTASYGLFKQQFGRGLRLGIDNMWHEAWEDISIPQRLQIISASKKPVAYIHDHVGNVIHFGGPPTRDREATLDDTKRSNAPTDGIPLRVCLNTKCLQPFERFHTHCPFCHTAVPAPVATALPAQVDGDIYLYTPDMYKRYFGVETYEAALAVQPDTFCKIPPNMPSMVAVRGIQAEHQKKLQAQQRLGSLLPLVMPPTMTPRQQQKRFYLTYGVDVVSARLLARAETEQLIERIQSRLTNRKS